jgi:hypothetical protein
VSRDTPRRLGRTPQDTEATHYTERRRAREVNVRGAPRETANSRATACPPPSAHANAHSARRCWVVLHNAQYFVPCHDKTIQWSCRCLFLVNKVHLVPPPPPNNYSNYQPQVTGARSLNSTQVLFYSSAEPNYRTHTSSRSRTTSESMAYLSATN